MGALTERLDKGTVTVWLDHTDYSAALLNKGVVPWLDGAEFVSLQRKAQGLLKSDVVALPLAPACAAWVAMHADLAAAMGSKSRIGFPLKTLLGDDALRAHLVEIANSLRASLAGTIFALVLPSPRAWLGLACAQAHGSVPGEVDDDDADGAAVYVADFLRDFASSGVDALLLEEAPGFAPSGAEGVALYQAVLNVAANYRWDAGVKVDGAIAVAATAALDYAIAASPPASARCGIAIGTKFWDTESAVPASAFRYATIPARTKPETVLDRLAALR